MSYAVRILTLVLFGLLSILEPTYLYIYLALMPLIAFRIYVQNRTLTMSRILVYSHPRFLGFQLRKVRRRKHA